MLKEPVSLPALGAVQSRHRSGSALYIQGWVFLVRTKDVLEAISVRKWKWQVGWKGEAFTAKPQFDNMVYPTDYLGNC